MADQVENQDLQKKPNESDADYNARLREHYKQEAEKNGSLDKKDQSAANQSK